MNTETASTILSESTINEDDDQSCVKENDPLSKRLYHREKLYGFLRQRRKPSKGAMKDYILLQKKENEDFEAYAQRCYKVLGYKPVAVGPMKMPKPNKPCPCGAKYQDGKSKKFKLCCGRGIA